MTAYDLPNLHPGGSAFGGPSYGQFGLLDPSQQGYAPLTARKPSILDRLAARLFPAGNYTGLLDPQAQQGLQRQGLLQFGQNLLQQSGPSPVRVGLGQAVGNALGGVNFPQMAEQALQLQAYKSQLAERQAVAHAVAQHPPQSGETREQAYNRLTQIISDVAGTPGGIETAARLAPVLAALKPDRGTRREPLRIEGTNTKLGTRFIGQEGTLLIDPDTQEQVGFYPKGTKPKEPTPAERVASSQYESASGSVAAMKAIAGRNPAAAKEAVAAIKAARYGKAGLLYSELRGQLSSQDAQDFYTNYNNAILAITPTYGGARPTQQLLDLEKSATLPAIGSGDFQSAFTHMEGRLKDLKAKAGKAFQEPPGTPAGKYRATNPFAP